MSFNITNRDRGYIVPTNSLLNESNSLRRRFNAELDEIKSKLQVRKINEHPSTSLVSSWYESLIQSLQKREGQDSADLNLVKNEYIGLLVNIVVTAKLGDTKEPMPIVEFMSDKLSDKTSVFYSEAYRERADKVIFEIKKIVEEKPKVSEKYMKLLRETEEKRAKEQKQEVAQMSKMDELRQKVRNTKEKKAALDAKMETVSKEILVKNKEISEKTKAQEHEFTVKNAEILSKVDELLNAAEEIRKVMPKLNEEVKLTLEETVRLKQATAQLHQDTQNLKKEMEEKGNWLTQLVCIAASVTLSIIFEQPIIISAGGVSFGMK